MGGQAVHLSVWHFISECRAGDVTGSISLEYLYFCAPHLHKTQLISFYNYQNNNEVMSGGLLQKHN